MNDYLFSGILMASSFTAGWMLYLFVLFLLKRRDGFFKGLKADLRRIKSPLNIYNNMNNKEIVKKKVFLRTFGCQI